MNLLHVTKEEWALAEQIMVEELQKHPHVCFKIRRKENSPLNKNLIHSFIVLATAEGPKLYAVARNKHYDEGYLGEGARGKVKVLETKEGELAAIKIEPELEPDANRQLEIAVLERRGHIYGTFSRQLDESVEWLEGESTNEKIYSILKLHPGVDMYEGYIENKDMNVKSLTEKQALIAAIKIAYEIKELHDHDEIHRDIKEANIILDQDESNSDLISAKLVDFETIVSLPEGEKSIEVEPVGSPGYCAPEAEDGICSKASDIYSFGRICQNLSIDEGTMLDDDPEKRPTIEEVIERLKSTLLQSCKNQTEMVILLNSEPDAPNYRVKKPQKEGKYTSNRPAFSQQQIQDEKENKAGWQRKQMGFSKANPNVLDESGQPRRTGGFLGAKRDANSKEAPKFVLGARTKEPKRTEEDDAKPKTRNDPRSK